jgi:hypothetical protein
VSLRDEKGKWISPCPKSPTSFGSGDSKNAGGTTPEDTRSIAKKDEKGSTLPDAGKATTDGTGKKSTAAKDAASPGPGKSVLGSALPDTSPQKPPTPLPKPTMFDQLPNMPPGGFSPPSGGGGGGAPSGSATPQPTFFGDGGVTNSFDPLTYPPPDSTTPPPSVASVVPTTGGSTFPPPSSGQSPDRQDTSRDPCSTIVSADCVRDAVSDVLQRVVTATQNQKPVSGDGASSRNSNPDAQRTTPQSVSPLKPISPDEVSYSNPPTSVTKEQTTFQDMADLFNLYPKITGSLIVPPAGARPRAPINQNRQSTAIAELYWVTRALSEVYGIAPQDVPALAQGINGVFFQEASGNPDVWNSPKSKFAGPPQTSKDRARENASAFRHLAEKIAPNLNADSRKVLEDIADRLDAIAQTTQDARKDLYTGPAMLVIQMFSLDPQGGPGITPGRGEGFTSSIPALQYARNPDGTLDPQKISAFLQTTQICPSCAVKYASDPNAKLDATEAGNLSNRGNRVAVKTGDRVTDAFDKMLQSKKNYSVHFADGINKMSEYLYGGAPASSATPNPVGPISFMNTVAGVLQDIANTTTKIVKSIVAPLQPTQIARNTPQRVPVPPGRPSEFGTIDFGLYEQVQKTRAAQPDVRSQALGSISGGNSQTPTFAAGGNTGAPALNTTQYRLPESFGGSTQGAYGQLGPSAYPAAQFAQQTPGTGFGPSVAPVSASQFFRGNLQLTGPAAPAAQTGYTYTDPIARPYSMSALQQFQGSPVAGGSAQALQQALAYKNPIPYAYSMSGLPTSAQPSYAPYAGGPTPIFAQGSVPSQALGSISGGNGQTPAFTGSSYGQLGPSAYPAAQFAQQTPGTGFGPSVAPVSASQYFQNQLGPSVPYSGGSLPVFAQGSVPSQALGSISGGNSQTPTFAAGGNTGAPALNTTQYRLPESFGGSTQGAYGQLQSPSMVSGIDRVSPDLAYHYAQQETQRVQARDYAASLYNQTLQSRNAPLSMTPSSGMWNRYMDIGAAEIGKPASVASPSTPSASNVPLPPSRPGSFAPQTFQSNVGFGAHGSTVSALQQRLIDEGYLRLVHGPSGYYGLLTRNAVIRYQRDHGILQTGFTGPVTRCNLNGGTYYSRSSTCRY